MYDESTYLFPHVEPIIQRFYLLFTTERVHFLSHIQGSVSEQYVARLFSRLLFLYFIQKKGLLDGDTHYLLNRMHMMQQSQGYNTFYRHFLLRLFHEGLAHPERSPELAHLLGNVPYLDHALFAVREKDLPQIDDAAFEGLFAFFETYHWHLDIHPLHGSEDEITPDILGYIFEKYINQQQMGAYYTQADITEYIAKNTLIPYLFDAVARAAPSTTHKGWQLLRTHPDRYIYPALRSTGCLPTETAHEALERNTRYSVLRNRLIAGEIRTIDALISENLDICQFAYDTICSIDDPELLYAYYEQLTHLTILDPTCGSGAFLFAALNVLLPLYEACFERIQGHDWQDERLLAPRLLLAGKQPQRYVFLMMIIRNNLYGVDIMEEATELCKLRLLLKLVTHSERIEDVEPLPDAVHEHIRTGNALVGYTTSTDSCAGMMLHENGALARSMLDRSLAREYGIDPNDRVTLANWQNTHRPFHWCYEFSTVFQHGGFHVIIGNPPYVEYNEKAFAYALRDFVTLRCANLYTCVIERSRQLLAPQGRQGMILPLAAFATKNMLPFIEAFQHWFPCSWLSFYHFRPAMLFSGGKVASIPTTIYLARIEGAEQRFSTHVLKWSREQRDLLFESISYCRVTMTGDPHNRHYYPKFGVSLENAIMCKILLHQPIKHYLTRESNQNRMFYRSAGGLYWKVFVNFAWPYDTTSNKQCTFQECYERDVFVALFNSSLFWWYYTVTFDTFNLKDYMLFGFRFTYPEDETTIMTLKQLCHALMEDFRRHARHLKRGETGSYTIYARKSKHIIDEIDRVLAQHYGFTEKELDFILHYDMKYRMGAEMFVAERT